MGDLTGCCVFYFYFFVFWGNTKIGGGVERPLMHESAANFVRGKGASYNCERRVWGTKEACVGN
jgi:hypothetical protein